MKAKEPVTCTHYALRITHYALRVRGQAAVIIALSMLLLVAAVGLAVDGGAMYVQRRTAQNSSDAAALAAARTMLGAYDNMVLTYPYDVDGTATDEAAISGTLTLFANAHGIPRDNLEAYYVNYDRQVVTTTQVGFTGLVPWTLGARGIAVKNSALTESLFMRVFGWDQIGATATSIAFMGISGDSSSTNILPIGLYTTTLDFSNIEFGQTYQLLDGDVTEGSGTWEWVDFNGAGNDDNVMHAWIGCGYNPGLGEDDWPIWCSDYYAAPGWGPTRHYESSTTLPTFDPAGNPTNVPMLIYGQGSDGWWIGGSSAGAKIECREFRQSVLSRNEGNGAEFMFPVLDVAAPDTGNGPRYHLLTIANFYITEADIHCQPQPEPGFEDKPDLWSVKGVARSFVQSIATGRRGDLRRTSGHTVFLDN